MKAVRFHGIHDVRIEDIEVSRQKVYDKLARGEIRGRAVLVP